MEESYEINYIAVKGGSIKIRYSVSPTGGVPEENIVSRSDKPHEDFQRVWSKLANIARRFLEMPLENAGSGLACKGAKAWSGMKKLRKS